MNLSLKGTFFLLVLSALLHTSFSYSADLAKAKELKVRLQAAHSRVASIINSASGHPHLLGPITEEDSQALARLSLANISLEQAAELAEQSELAFSSLNFDLGNYQFVRSCSQAAISRSRVARANLLANQPPVGFLAAFSTDMGDIVNELQDLKQDVGCP